jgi:hypothetical protein
MRAGPKVIEHGEAIMRTSQHSAKLAGRCSLPHGEPQYDQAGLALSVEVVT